MKFKESLIVIQMVHTQNVLTMFQQKLHLLVNSE